MTEMALADLRFTTVGHPMKDKRQATVKAMLASRALNRISLMAKDEQLKENSPRLVLEANQWLYEIEHGKPHISVDQRIQSLSYVITGDDLAKLGIIQAGLALADKNLLKLSETC